MYNCIFCFLWHSHPECDNAQFICIHNIVKCKCLNTPVVIDYIPNHLVRDVVDCGNEHVPDA